MIRNRNERVSFVILDRFIQLIGESTSGQRALYEIGMTGIPIYNCNSNCSTGANALILAKQLIETGQNDCVLAVGFEKMERGSLGAKVLNYQSNHNENQYRCL